MACRLKLINTILLLLVLASLRAQNYQALHGSSYAGSLGAVNNPASVVHVPFAWDVVPFAIQAKHSTNAFVVNNFSMLSPSAKTSINVTPGQNNRFFMSNQDIRILNARFRINESSAFAFGASIRSFQSIKTSGYNWQDSIETVRQFMAANISNSPIAAELRASSWAEIYGTYARTIISNDNALLNAGITIKVNRGLGAGYVNTAGLYMAPGVVHGQNGYLLTNGRLEFGYSSNLDILDSGGTNTEKRKRFLQKTWSSLSMDIGAEYIIPSETSDDFYTYDLKIGLSLLDIGYNKFQYSPNSRSAVLDKGNISDSLIDATFKNVKSANALPDSIASVAGSTANLSGFFKMLQPPRIVINADKRIAGNFFLNAELTLPLIFISGQNKLFIRDMNFAALTPRFETRNLGVYLPLTLNTKMQLWSGGAIKAGPLLAGIHNWANLFAKNKIQNGGAYVALILHPGRRREGQNDNAGEKNKGGKKSTRRKGQFGCPVNVM